MPSKASPSQLFSSSLSIPPDYDEDDDFQIPPSQTQPQALTLTSTAASLRPRKPLKPSSNPRRSSKKAKLSANPGKENVDPTVSRNIKKPGSCEHRDFKLDENCSLDMIESSIDCSYKPQEPMSVNEESEKNEALKVKGCGYLSNSVEARLMKSKLGLQGEEEDEFGVLDEGSELDRLIKLCAEEDEQNSQGNADEDNDDGGCFAHCPLCGNDISELSEESRLLHTNDCIDNAEKLGQDVDDRVPKFQPQGVVRAVSSPPRPVDDASPVVNWLRNLGLERYVEGFLREEIDWDTLQWLTEEDLFSIGVTALGPRKKIVHALSELQKECNHVLGRDGCALSEAGSMITTRKQMREEVSKVVSDETKKSASNKLITDYFPGSVNVRKRSCTVSKDQRRREKSHPDSVGKRAANNAVRNRKLKDIPVWCSIPGTPFRVDAFKYLRGDCSHWFLTHFHMDHYQGLTRSFCHGKIYCSLITARLVNMKIGVPWDRLQVLPLHEKITIAGVDVTCLDANHCPGSVIMLFEPPNGKAVLHTGDFRFCEKMANTSVLQMCPIHTLILDTTYCNPQYDFPKQEAVIQFVVEAIQAEAFNPKTLFLIGSYTIGKERLFLEVARVLRRKVHVTAAKFRLLECLGLSEEDMQWFTLNELESQIHVVPMWTLASFKRLKHISSQYAARFSLIVAFLPTGWTFGKGKKKSPGKRWRQGTIIRYEVPYSEHCSFEELREFVKFVSPEKVIPSVNNDGPDSVDTMVSLLLS